MDLKRREQFLSPEAEKLRDFVEALLEVGTWTGIRSINPSVSLMEWRHHSYATTLAGLEAYDRDGAARVAAEHYVVQSGNPMAVRDWFSSTEAKRNLRFNWSHSVEIWTLDLIRDEVIRQEIVRWWPDQAMRLIAFVLLRDNIVDELDFQRLSNLNRAQLGKHVRELGRSPMLEVAKPSQSTSRAASREVPSRRAAESVDSKLERWLRLGKRWIVGAKVQDDSYRSFLAGLHKAGARWPTTSSPKPQKPPDRDWLDEILARAEDVAPLLRFAPAWPTTFSDTKHRITIAVIDQTLVGWVEVGRSKTLLSVDLDSWEVSSRGARGEDDVAAGLVISWYLDSCICLRKQSHPHYRSERIGGRSAAGAPRRGVIYLPTPKFRSDLSATRQGIREAPRAHRVRGHVRELSSSRSPSVAARNNAPRYIRRHLKRQETFVQSHSRGKESKTREITLYLSKYSTLADALGSLA